MTISSDAGDDRQYRAWYRFVRRHTRWCSPALMQLGHYAFWLVIPVTGLIIANDATGQPGWLSWLGTGAWFALFAAIGVDQGYHSARLCERCMGATPLDPQAAVERWKPALRLEHRNRFIVALLVADLAWSLGTGQLLVDGVHSLGLPRHHVIWAYFLRDIPALIIIGGYLAVVRIHRDLYPWCPWCHWRNGGDAETVPDPAPDPAVSR